MANGQGGILIIDDEEDVRQSMAWLLKSKGFRKIDAADSGEAGLRKLAEKEYDMVLLDLIMPKMSGWGVLEELSRRRTAVRVLVVSAVGLPEVVGGEVAKKYPGVDFIGKTHATDGLVLRVKEMLKKPAKPL